MCLESMFWEREDVFSVALFSKKELRLSVTCVAVFLPDKDNNYFWLVTVYFIIAELFAHVIVSYLRGGCTLSVSYIACMADSSHFLHNNDTAMPLCALVMIMCCILMTKQLYLTAWSFNVIKQTCWNIKTTKYDIKSLHKRKYLCWGLPLCWLAQTNSGFLVHLQSPDSLQSFPPGLGHFEPNFLYWETPKSHLQAVYWGQVQLQCRLTVKEGKCRFLS